MSAISVGYGPEDGGPLPTVDPNDLPKESFPGKDLDWASERIPVQLTVEVPFWLMIPDCEVTLTHDGAVVSAAVKNDYTEVIAGPFYQDSRANVVYVGPPIENRSKELPRSVASTARPIIRFMKTVVQFKAEALKDVFQAWQELSLTPREEVKKYLHAMRRRNEAHGYLQGLRTIKS